MTYQTQFADPNDMLSSETVIPIYQNLCLDRMRSEYRSQFARRKRQLESCRLALMALTTADEISATPQPNLAATTTALKFLEAIAKYDSAPDRVVINLDGGLTFYFFFSRRTAFVQFLNDNTNVVAAYAKNDQPDIQEFAPTEIDGAVAFLERQRG